MPARIELAVGRSRASLAGVLATLPVLLLCALRSSAESGTTPDHWLLMVRTINTDPSRKQDFNDWYNNIDIPDVLAVPGFRRAVRAQLADSCADAATPCARGGDRYVALYNIESRAIDKTIIDMLMATWKMLRTGRDTPLLEVEERVYYHEAAAPSSVGTATAEDAQRFLLLERFDLAPQVSTRRLQRLLAEQARRLSALTREVRMARYELYRVLMFEPREAPHYLTVYSFPADSAAAAEEVARALNETAGRQRTEGYLHAQALLYWQIADVTVAASAEASHAP